MKLDNIGSADKCFIWQFRSLITVMLRYDCCGVPVRGLFNPLKGLMGESSCLTWREPAARAGQSPPALYFDGCGLGDFA